MPDSDEKAIKCLQNMLGAIVAKIGYDNAMQIVLAVEVGNNYIDRTTREYWVIDIMCVDMTPDWVRSELLQFSAQ